jgi:hypothetical protein
MTIRTDLSALDHKYRAKRYAQHPSEYAAAVEIFRKPARHWPVILITAAIVLAAVYVGVRT